MKLHKSASELEDKRFTGLFCHKLDIAEVCYFFSPGNDQLDQRGSKTLALSMKRERVDRQSR